MTKVMPAVHPCPHLYSSKFMSFRVNAAFILFSSGSACITEPYQRIEHWGSKKKLMVNWSKLNNVWSWAKLDFAHISILSFVFEDRNGRITGRRINTFLHKLSAIYFDPIVPSVQAHVFLPGSMPALLIENTNFQLFYPFILSRVLRWNV